MRTASRLGCRESCPGCGADPATLLHTTLEETRSTAAHRIPEAVMVPDTWLKPVETV